MTAPPAPAQDQQHEYLFDVTITATVRVKADSLHDANLLLQAAQGVETSIALEPTPDGATGTVTEISIDGQAISGELFDQAVSQMPDLQQDAGWTFWPVEVDGEDISTQVEPNECTGCKTIYDEAGGDGYDGECPSCADKTWKEGEGQ